MNELLPHDVGVLEPLQLLEQGDLPEDGHGYPVLGQREPHLLQGHDVARHPVPSLVDRSVGA